ncbi:PREDICTED: oxysterol-binding protein 2-like [Cyprinodon variegatus]|uniref:oxysterol-binding protein 2-like n=1 Tax=Cyprinodon variegatus TaxID=28743 RepID=UPI00074261DB|nr:PREDICTED: oxysterol-binding protein 2-like [Cyprinodon variegatus]
MSEQGKGSASTSTAAPAPGSDTYKGWLFKWTNYLKGYQRRWFVLSNGLLSYYRTQAEMAHTCRGTINLATAHIDTEDACNIVLSSGGRTYHLKASTEVERQRWVTALELAKAKAIRMMNDQSGKSSCYELLLHSNEPTVTFFFKCGKCFLKRVTSELSVFFSINLYNKTNHYIII